MAGRKGSPISASGGWRNWAGDQVCLPARVERPADLEQLREAVTGAVDQHGPVSVTGSGHSFTEAAMCDHTMIDVAALSGVIEADPDSGLVRVGAGTSLARLNSELDRLGLAMENLGDIDRQTVAGAISTATHGTGARLGNISSQVAAVQMVLADGTVHEADSGEDLLAARVGVGALGAISAVTLRCLPAFNLHRVDEPRQLDPVLADFHRLAAENDHFEFFVFPHTRKALTIRRNRTDRPARPRGRLRRFAGDVVLENGFGDLAMRFMRWRPGLIPRLTPLIAGVMSQGDQLDLSHRIFANYRTLRFTEMEYALPREHGPEAIDRVLGLIESERFRVPMPIECRVVAADDALLSPSHARDTTYIAVHQYRGMEWRPYFEAVEQIMRSYDGRPHWGKRHFRTAADLAPAYPRWREFQAVRDRLDPDRRFTNEYAGRVLGH